VPQAIEAKPRASIDDQLSEQRPILGGTRDKASSAG
jgi:hypothetical protein